MMLVNRDNILSLIPQRPPFVFVDELVFSDESMTSTRFKVLANCNMVEDGVLLAPGIIENIAQTAAARAGYLAKSNNLPVFIGYIGSVNDLQVVSLPKINDTLETEITIKNQIFDVTIISGKVSVEGEVIANCEMKIFIIKQ